MNNKLKFTTTKKHRYKFYTFYRKIIRKKLEFVPGSGTGPGSGSVIPEETLYIYLHIYLPSYIFSYFLFISACLILRENIYLILSIYLHVCTIYIYLLLCLFIDRSIHAPIYLPSISIYLHMYLSILLFICLFNLANILEFFLHSYLYIFDPPIYLSIS